MVRCGIGGNSATSTSTSTVGIGSDRFYLSIRSFYEYGTSGDGPRQMLVRNSVQAIACRRQNLKFKNWQQAL
eukprot:scaffold108184_cov33-Prasinocladus_malaysianus.AAC.2